MRFLILGSGFQGRARAYDMPRNPAATEGAPGDMSAANLASARKFLAKVSGGRAKFKRLDAGNPAAVKKALKGYSALVSCVPYFLNLPLAKAAIAARVHYVDLGGSTDIVRKEIALHPLAVKAGGSDTGRGRGMVSPWAPRGRSMPDAAGGVLMREGALPQRPVPPMNYML